MSSPILENAESLDVRVTRLERRALLATGVAAGALLLAGVATTVAVVAFARLANVELPGPSTGAQLIEASEIVLRDERGDLRGRWTIQGLSLADRNGRLRAALSVGPDGAPNLGLFGKEGRTRAVLGLGSEDAPALTLHDGQSGVRARIAVTAEAAPTLTFSNTKGDVVTQLPPPTVTAPRKGRSR